MAPSGLSNGPIETNRALYTALTIITALSWYNLFELNFLIFVTFKRYNGLYFWSLLIASWGTAVQALGFLLKFFPTGANVYLCVFLITIGWWSMVTGHSVVLYSRLNLVVQEKHVLKRVLIMIIVDAILFHTPTTVLTFGTNSDQTARFAEAYSIMEKIQMTFFSLQEMIIAGLYVRATRKFFEPKGPRDLPKPIIELVLVNFFIIIMNITLLGVEYASLYDVEVLMKSFIYTIKLKLEFAVLSDLKSYRTPTMRKQSTTQDEQAQPRPREWRLRSSISSPTTALTSWFPSRKQSAAASYATPPAAGVVSASIGESGMSKIHELDGWNISEKEDISPHSQDTVPGRDARSSSVARDPMAGFVSESDSEAEFGAYQEIERDDEY